MSPDSFKDRFPAFAATDITVIQAAIDDADPFFDRCRWCNLYEQGLGNFVAHNLTMDAALQAGTLSAISTEADYTSKSVGEVSVSKDAGLISKYANDPFMRTIYGQRYLYFRRIVGSGAVAV